MSIPPYAIVVGAGMIWGFVIYHLVDLIFPAMRPGAKVSFRRQETRRRQKMALVLALSFAPFLAYVAVEAILHLDTLMQHLGEVLVNSGLGGTTSYTTSQSAYTANSAARKSDPNYAPNAAPDFASLVGQVAQLVSGASMAGVGGMAGISPVAPALPPVPSVPPMSPASPVPPGPRVPPQPPLTSPDVPAPAPQQMPLDEPVVMGVPGSEVASN